MVEDKEIKSIASALDTVSNALVFKVELSFGEVEVYKCKVKDIGVVLELVTKVIDCMKIDTLTSQPTLDIGSPVVILKLMSESLQTTKRAITSLCSLTPEEFDRLDLEDALPLITKAWDINKVFFYQTLLPMIPTVSPGQVSQEVIKHTLPSKSKKPRQRKK